MELWRADVRNGRRNAMPSQTHMESLARQFDWESRSRVVEDGSGALAGAVLVAASESPSGPLADIDVAATTVAEVQELARWGIALSRASGAVAAMAWVSRGEGEHLREVGLKLARPWWRMDRSLETALPAPRAVAGYDLLDGSTVTPGLWSDVYNRSFADHWRFSFRGEEELVDGGAPELRVMAITTGRQPAAMTISAVETLDTDSRPQPVGIVRTVGTMSEHRRQGLAAWLVAEALTRLRQAGARHASLYVDGWNHSRAFDVYRKLGFEVAFEAEVWEATFP
jgi:ribosomal protein S18 acetylase RimI-like enzyme